ncbi:uncharacterized protein [Elaeis guineensis]|uniref:uncharacterized protein n=1 Tax=Elaeis guineensis var. tenera TaxID=51953 RepID=UPI003C6CE41A
MDLQLQTATSVPLLLPQLLSDPDDGDGSLSPSCSSSDGQNLSLPPIFWVLYVLGCWCCGSFLFGEGGLSGCAEVTRDRRGSGPWFSLRFFAYPMNIIVWNGRGAAKPSLLNNFHDLVRKHQPDIICVLKTRLSGDSIQKFHLSVGNQWQISSIPSIGLSGGIIILWHRNFDHVQFDSSIRQLAVGVVSAPRVQPWLLGVVYASTDYCEHRFFWEMAAAGMDLDTPLESAFAWCNYRFEHARVWERLDRALSNDEWINCFSDSTVTHLRTIALCYFKSLLNLLTSIDHLSGFTNSGYQLKRSSKWSGELGVDRLVRLMEFYYSKTPNRHCLNGTRICWKNKRRTFRVGAPICCYSITNVSEYQRTTVIRRRRNKIFSSLMTQDGEVNTDSEIANTITNYFASHRNNHGPSGFRPLLYKHFWPITRNDVLAAIHEVFDSGSMPMDLKDTHLVLIPKIPNPREVKDYRPIRLYNTVYKWVAKILINRMKSLLPNLISLEQGAFVPARNISDNIMLAQKIFHSMESASGTNSLMVVKADMEKAYDRLSWRYLEAVLYHYGFYRRFICWIMAYVLNPRFSVLINGRPSPWFHSAGGVR